MTNLASLEHGFVIHEPSAPRGYIFDLNGGAFYNNGGTDKRCSKGGSKYGCGVVDEEEVKAAPSPKRLRGGEKIRAPGGGGEQQVKTDTFPITLLLLGLLMMCVAAAVFRQSKKGKK